MDWQLSVRRLLECEDELSKSRRLQGVRAAGGNAAQAVLFAGTEGRSEDLNHPQIMQLLVQVFSELRKLMADKTATDEPLFAASGQLYDSVVRK